MPDKTLDVQIVTHRPELGLLDDLIASLHQQDTAGWTVTLRILDNSADATVSQTIRERIERHEGRYGLAAIDFVVSAANVGFGAGHNQLQQRGSGELILLLNQDVVLEPDALATLLDEAGRAEAN